MSPGIPKVNISALVDELDKTGWRKLKADLQRAVERERSCGTTKPDGYSAGGEGGGGTPGFSNPTLSAYLARETQHHDSLRAHTVEAVTLVVSAASALSKARKHLQSIDDLMADAPITPKGCDLCTAAGLKRDGLPVPWDHKGSVGGRLSTDMHLCLPHYQFVNRHGFAPTSEQTRHWYATGTWKIRETA